MNKVFNKATIITILVNIGLVVVILLLPQFRNVLIAITIVGGGVYRSIKEKSFMPLVSTVGNRLLLIVITKFLGTIGFFMYMGVNFYIQKKKASKEMNSSNDA